METKISVIVEHLLGKSVESIPKIKKNKTTFSLYYSIKWDNAITKWIKL